MTLWLLVVLYQGHLNSVWAFADRPACEQIVRTTSGGGFTYPGGCTRAKLWIDMKVWDLVK
jgi:hypothetical protein